MRRPARPVQDNLGLICACAVAGLALGLAATAMAPVQYTAAALISMSSRPGQGQADAAILDSPPVLRAAASTAGLLGRSPSADALADIRRRLKVEVERGTDLVRIAFADPSQPRSLAVVQAVVDAARDQRRAMAAAPWLEPPAQQPQALPDQARLAQALRDMDDQIQALQIRSGGGDVAQDTQAAAALDDRLTSTIRQAQERLRSLDRQLDTARDQMDADESPVFKMTAGGALIQQRPAGGDVRPLAARISALSVERARLADQVRDLQDQQAESRIHIGDLRQAQTQLDQLRQARDALAVAYRQAQEQAVARLKSDQLAIQAAGIRILQPPSATAGRRVNPLFVAAGGVAGLACALALIVAMALARGLRRVLRPIRLPILAELSLMDGEPGAKGAQAIARLAAALVASDHAARPLSVLQVSGPGQGEDKVALALLLGSEFAESWRLSTLVIDLGGEAQQELRHEAVRVQPVTFGGMQMALLKTQYPNIWAITRAGGPASPFGNPCLSLDRVEEAVTAMRSRFEKVIMIAPSDFEGEGARRLNALADGHLLVVHSRKSRARRLRRLRGAIAASGGRILGMIHTHADRRDALRASTDHDVPPARPTPASLALAHYREPPSMAAE
jgi:hypothetical protein